MELNIENNVFYLIRKRFISKKNLEIVETNS